MTHRVRFRASTVLIAAGALAAGLAASGCPAQAAPRGVKSALERTLGVELQREVGLDLGPFSTSLVKSITADDVELRDLDRIHVAVYKVIGSHGAPARRVTAADLGVRGWTKILESRDGGEQVLLLAKPAGDEIREMMLLSVDEDEVVVAHLHGRLDRLIHDALAAGDHEGRRGARTASDTDGE